jgi:hypothetical protein
MTHTDDTKQATAHSPEPWHTEPLQADRGGSIAVCNRRQGILAVIPPLNEDDGPDEATAQRDPCDEANARRLCAAVNACQGIGTEALEQGVIRELREALDYLLAQTVDQDLKYGIGLTEGEEDARAMALAALAKATAVESGG